MWVGTGNSAIEESLFYFLISLSEGKPRVQHPLICTPEDWNELISTPSMELQKALGYCLEQTLIELGHISEFRHRMAISSAIWGVCLATYNCLSTHAVNVSQLPKNASDPAFEFTSSIIDAIPKAVNIEEMLAYHAILRHTIPNFSRLGESSVRWLGALIERSPLTAVWAINAYTPEVLIQLGKELLHTWDGEGVFASGIWQSPGDWLDAVDKLLQNQHLARQIRQRWLNLSESRRSCRNIGLFLELLLRNQGRYRDFILQYYEAYDYFSTSNQSDSWNMSERTWPIMDHIEKLLRTETQHPSALTLNRQGHEYFLKFYPLIQIIIEEKGVPVDYEFLSLEFANKLARLASYVSYKNQQETHMSLGKIQFGN